MCIRDRVILDPDSGQVTLIGDEKDTAQVAKAFDALAAQTAKATAERNAAGEAEMEKDEQKQDTDPVAPAWTPPEDPDPKKILDEAKADKDSGDYQIALAKHVWYHENAHRSQRTGFRRTPAMSHWLELGEKYPPALDKMREIRDATEARMRDKNRIRVNVDDFDYFAALNHTLQDEHLTANFFVWLDEVDADDAGRHYIRAQEALVTVSYTHLRAHETLR